MDYDDWQTEAPRPAYFSDIDEAEHRAWFGLVNGSLDGLLALIRAGIPISQTLAGDIADTIEGNIAGYQLKIVGQRGQKLGWHGRARADRKRIRIGRYVHLRLGRGLRFDAAICEAVAEFRVGRKKVEAELTFYRNLVGGRLNLPDERLFDLWGHLQDVESEHPND